jgi:anti-sigma factor RsiW
MDCQQSRLQLDAYVDGELSEPMMRELDAHVRSCGSCASDVLARVQMKRAIHSAAMRYTPDRAFRDLVQARIAPKGVAPRRTWYWQFAAAVALIVFAVGLAYVWQQRTATQRTFTEIADLHVTNLASSTPVDVTSSDRHTVKPWFAGKIPFTFNLPELQNTGFTLLGGRVVYLDQVPGAELVYQVRQHRISVFIFPDRFFERLPGAVSQRQQSFDVRSWNQGGLRYFAIGDTSDVDGLAKLFKIAQQG